MQLNIFVQAAPLLKEKKSNINYTSIINFLGKYKHGDLIYPSAIRRSLKLDTKDIYDVLELCENSGLVERQLAIYCPNCQRFSGHFYNSLLDIPPYITCKHCDDELVTKVENIIVIYRVI